MNLSNWVLNPATDAKKKDESNDLDEEVDSDKVQVDED